MNAPPTNLQNSGMPFPPCPVCGSLVTGHVRDVLTRRTQRHIPLYGCFDCRSFWNPSGYKEDDAQLERDLAWGVSVHERNKNAARRFFARLASLGVAPKSVVEIGCGVGALLAVARELGMRTVGFDVNERAVRHAVDMEKLDARAEIWSVDTDTGPVDLYLNISVLEHIEQPRPLLRDLCQAAARQNAALFISVPFVERASWIFVLDPDPHAPGTPFFDNDVHVTHFSVAGLMAAMREFGQSNLEYVEAGLWNGVLARPLTAQD